MHDVLEWTQEDEAARAREALLELVASELDAALMLTLDRSRGSAAGAIAARCARIRLLSEAAAAI